MNVSINRVSGFVMLAGMLGAYSLQAAAKAEFHLPVPAHWGNQLLTPGDYNIRVQGFESGVKQVVVQAGDKPMWQLPGAIDQEAVSNTSSLKLVQVNGEYFVKEYKLGSAGKVYTFGIPKSAKTHSSKDVELSTK